MKKTLLALTVLLPTLIFAHEGHDHAPGSLKSIHGGVVSAGKEINLEVLINGHEITVYPIRHEGKDIAAKDVKIEAMAKPKKGAASAVKLLPAKGGYTATVDLQGANRLPVEITTQVNGKADHFTIQVEE